MNRWRGLWGSARAGRPGWIGLVLFFVAYVLAAGFGQWLAIIPGIGITLWPPSGLFIAVLASTRRPTWPWWTVAGALAEITCNLIWFHNPLPMALAFISGNAIEAVVGAWLMLRVCGTAPRLETMREAAALVAAAAAAPVASATIGAATLALAREQPFATAWPLWWLGDGTGILIFAPVVLVVLHTWRDRARIRPVRLLEAGALGAVLVGLSALSLGGYLPFAYIMMLPLLWAAIRFEIRGAVATLSVLALLTAVFTVQGVSPFAGDAETQAHRHVMLQLFLAISAMSALIVGVLSRQHQRALARLRSANADLEGRVAARTAELSASEQRFRAMFSISSVGKVEVHPRTRRFLLVNDAFCTMTGYAEDELRNLSFLDLTHPEDRDSDRRGFEDLLAGGSAVFDIEKRIRRKDGTAFWARVTMNVLRDAYGQAERSLGVIIDIDSRRRQEDQLQFLMREVNHRSKNMLALIQAIARQTAATGTDDFLARFQNRIQALAASQDLLIVSDWKSVRLHDLVRSQLAHFGSTAEARIAIAGPPLDITASASQTLGMALHELGTNAAKYGALSTGDGRVAITWNLEPAAGDGGTRFTMAWTETGGPPVQPPLRTGFGSIVVGQLVRAGLRCDAALDFASEGVTWRISAPAGEVVEGGTPAGGHGPGEAASPALPLGGGRVLVVEDEPLIALEVVSALEEAGFRVVGPARSVHQALHLIESTGCDAAVLDINLGGETSEAVAERLKASGTPFVTVSGYALSQYPPAFRGAPYVAKPLVPARLVAAVAQCLDAPRR